MKRWYPAFSDTNWSLNELDTPGSLSPSDAQLCVLMDIRRELKTLSRLLGCQNFVEVPRILRGIRANTSKPRKRKKP